MPSPNSKVKSLPKRQQLRGKRPQPSEDEVIKDMEEGQSCIKSSDTSHGGGNGSSSSTTSAFNLAPIFRHLAGFLFGSFITLSYQPLVNDPICTPFMGKDPHDPNGGDVLVGIETLAWWKGFLVSTICDHQSKISGFLLRFGVSVSGAMIIALMLNFVFAKWKQAQPQYKDEFEMEVGNETWTLGTTLKIKKGSGTNSNNPPYTAAAVSSTAVATTTTPPGSMVDRGSAETLEAGKDGNEVDPDEALRFLFKAIDHFGKNTEVIKQNPSLESLFHTADICAALSHLDKRVVKNWPDVLDSLVSKLKEEQNRDSPEVIVVELPTTATATV